VPVCAVLRATMNKTGQFTKIQYEKEKSKFDHPADKMQQKGS
jgi:hypothetical protein